MAGWQRAGVIGADTRRVHRTVLLLGRVVTQIENEENGTLRPSLRRVELLSATVSGRAAT